MTGVQYTRALHLQVTMDRKRKAQLATDIEAVPKEVTAAAGPPTLATQSGVQHRRIRNGTVAAGFIVLLILLGVFSAVHFSHLGILHSKTQARALSMLLCRAASCNCISYWVIAALSTACMHASCQRAVAPHSIIMQPSCASRHLQSSCESQAAAC